MATAVAPHSIGVKLASDLPGRRFDHVFFSAMALLMLATVFVGFAPTYYLAGMFRAPLPSLIIHLHGAAFSAWILLLVTQTSLVSAGRVDIHRRLGIAGFLLFAFRARSNPPAHKRLILIATVALMIAAIARWPFSMVHRKPDMAALFSYIFLGILMAYDLWSTRKLHRATVWASALLIFVEQIRTPIGKTAAWHAFAGWVQSLAR